MKFKDKDEFILAVMDGRKFNMKGYILHYDSNEINPFRFNENSMNASWIDILEEEFEEVLPEPAMEERWKLGKDEIGHTLTTNSYYNQNTINANWKDWYKLDSIMVEVK